MKVTKVVVKLYNDQRSNTEAYATITLDDAIVIRDARVVAGPKGLFLAMPSRMLKDKATGKPRKKENGKTDFRDIVFPCTPQARELLQTAVLIEFNKVKDLG